MASLSLSLFLSLFFAESTFPACAHWPRRHASTSRLTELSTRLGDVHVGQGDVHRFFLEPHPVQTKTAHISATHRSCWLEMACARCQVQPETYRLLPVGGFQLCLACAHRVSDGTLEIQQLPVQGRLQGGEPEPEPEPLSAIVRFRSRSPRRGAGRFYVTLKLLKGMFSQDEKRDVSIGWQASQENFFIGRKALDVFVG